MREEDPVVCVSGASAGVGRAIALEFARRRHARLGLIARSKQALEAVRDEVLAAGGQALVLPLDVADATAVQKAADLLAERFGRIDIWVNVAMVTVYGRVRDLGPVEVQRVTDVTYLGAVYGTMAAL